MEVIRKRQLSQDQESNKEGNEDVYLVNTASVREDAEANCPCTEAHVELVFRHRGVKYTMRRSLTATCPKGKHTEKKYDKEIKLYEEGTTYDTKEYDEPDEIKDKINNILDIKVREFFLFDGEKIEMLTRASEIQRKDISRAVIQLLNIDSIATAIKKLNDIKKDLSAQILKTATGEYGKSLTKKNAIEDEISANNQRKSELESEKDKAFREKEDLEAKLKKYEGVKQKIEQKKELEESSVEFEKSLQFQRTNLATILSDVAPFLCDSIINQVHTCLAEKVKNNDIPSRIRTNFIEDLLQKKKCICGRPIDERSVECKALMDWLEKVEYTQKIDESAWKLFNNLESFYEVESKKDVLKSANNTLLEYTTTKNKKQKANEKIQSIMEDLGGTPGEDITSFSKQLGKIDQDIVHMQAGIINIEKINKDLQDEIDSLNIKIDKEKKEKNIRNLNQDKYDLAENAEKILKSAQNEYIEEIRSIISTETAKNLRAFLDEESQSFFSKVVVDEKYSLQITDAHGTPFLANISAGQRQLLSLAFITALAQTAAAGNLPEMPLFMDTPFGRLSLEHRQNLIKSIPDLCAQWVLLATDTELRREEAEYLKQTGRLGYFYRLTTYADNETRIELVETEKAIRQLNSGKEVKA